MTVIADGRPVVVDEAQRKHEDTASPEERALREAATDDLCCFVTLLSIEDEDAILGLGLYVHPRTVRQRRCGLPPDLDLVFDYMDVEAFNEGIRRAAPEAEEWPPSMVSSARQRLNAWLPLYINARHWANAKRFAASAFSALVGRPFLPKDALDVCLSLLTCAVAGFTKSQAECPSPRTACRGKASERAVQMYADVHRLLLQMAWEHPELRAEASQRVRRFIEDPTARSRKSTPDLGSLVHCLLVVEDLTWEDLATSLVPEALRRHVMRQECNSLTFSSKVCRRSVERLIATWDIFAPDVGKAICFAVMFYQKVGRPHGSSLDDVAATYDRCWGRLHEDVLLDVIGACAALCQQHSVMEFLPSLFPGGQCSQDSIAELILWAEKYGTTASLGRPSWVAERRGHYVSGVADAKTPWPQLHGPCKLLKEWRPCNWRRRRPRQQRCAAPQEWHHGCADAAVAQEWHGCVDATGAELEDWQWMHLLQQSQQLQFAQYVWYDQPWC